MQPEPGLSFLLHLLLQCEKCTYMIVLYLMQGGYVDYCRGVWRLQGSLAVSRGIGDTHLKQWVIPDPETKILKIRPECEFLILASDGLWDKVWFLC